MDPYRKVRLESGVNFHRDPGLIYPSGGSIQPPAKSSTPAFTSTTLQPTNFGEWTPLLRASTHRTKSNVGLLLITAAQLFFAVINLLVKKLHTIDPPVGTLEIVVVRMGLTLLCCLTYMYWRKIPDPFLGPKGVRMLLAFRGFSGFLGLFGIYFSLNYLSLSDTTMLMFLVLLGTGFAASRFLGERVTKMEVFASVFSLLGVVLIARPPFLFGLETDPVSGHFVLIDSEEKVTPAERLLAVGVALLGAVGTVGSFISLREIGNQAHLLHAMVSFSTQSLIVASVMMFITHEPIVIPTQWEWTALLSIAIAGFSAQTLLTMGFIRETASRGTMGIYSQLVFAMILQWIFFGSLPSKLSIMGSLMIITSALYVVLKKEQANAKKRIPGSTDDDSSEEGSRSLSEDSDELSDSV